MLFPQRKREVLKNNLQCADGSPFLVQSEVVMKGKREVGKRRAIDSKTGNRKEYKTKWRNMRLPAMLPHNGSNNNNNNNHIRTDRVAGTSTAPQQSPSIW
ncbi:unnamed protein product, partial [Ceratitis capitata]